MLKSQTSTNSLRGFFEVHGLPPIVIVQPHCAEKQICVNSAKSAEIHHSER